MKIVGIIAEYNPFHNGHAYQIKKIRETTGADYIIAAMSGDFTQRGEPAIIDKYARAQMALSCGVDLVVELPVLWAVSSAESFARAGVCLFDQMGCVDELCFGAETDNVPLLSLVADILAEEPDAYKEILVSCLKDGKAFPLARATALEQYLWAVDFNSSVSPVTDSLMLQELSNILSAPNNILAIEYLKSLKLCHSNIRPHPILRNGAGYHNTDISAPNASASAIRSVLKSVSATPDAACKSDHNECFWEQSLKHTMPAEAFNVFSDYLKHFPYMEADDFSQILGYLLLTSSAESLSSFVDCNYEIARRLKKNLFSFSSVEQFTELNKSRDITYTRMSRVFMHMLLQMKTSDLIPAKNCNYVPYIRPLGFLKSSSGVLSQLKKHSAIPVIGKLANAPKYLSSNALSLLEKDIFAANLYEQILAQKKGILPRNEFTREIVLL